MGRFIVLAICLVTTTACSKPAANKHEQEPPKAWQQEHSFQAQSEEAFLEARLEARQTALDFVKATLPAWTLKGMAARAYAGYIFWIDADLEKNNRHVVISLETQKFFPENGEPYWLAVPIDKFKRERINDLDDAALLKRFDKLRHELEELETPPEEDRDDGRP